MAWTKVILEGDSITELDATAYRTFYSNSGGNVAELTHGASGKFLKSQGTAADPIWDDPSVATLDVIGDVAAITEAQGQVIYRSATAWDALDAGTSGYFLKTQGTGANPTWAAASVAEVNDIGNVDITSVGDDDILAWEATGTHWINKTAAEAGLATTSHKDAHDPEDGTDALDCAAAGNITPDATAAEGTAHSFARSDHTHGFSCGTPTSVGTTAAEGTASTMVRSDHVHDLGNDCIDSGDLIADDVVGQEHVDSTDTFTFAEIILTPTATPAGTTEGGIAYDSSDNHLYVYVV